LWWWWWWWWWWCFRSSFKKKLLYKTRHQFDTLDSSGVAEEGDGLHQEELPYIHTYIYMYVYSQNHDQQTNSSMKSNPMQAFYYIITCTLYVHINIPNCWNSKIFNLTL
jgi:hypothetical protein